MSLLQGESSGNLFPRPVYEEPPQEQRSNMLRYIKLLFVEVLLASLQSEYFKVSAEDGGQEHLRLELDGPDRRCLQLRRPLPRRGDASSGMMLFYIILNIKYYFISLYITMRAQALISSLSCWLDSRNEAWLLLQPVKVELVHRQPDIWLFHDVIR